MATRQVSLVLDGKVLETKSVNVPANGRASVEFLSLESPYGFHRGEVRIEPHDDLSADDRFPFAVERTDPRRVLFLHRGGEEPRRAVLPVGARCRLRIPASCWSRWLPIRPETSRFRNTRS